MKIKKKTLTISQISLLLHSSFCSLYPAKISLEQDATHVSLLKRRMAREENAVLCNDSKFAYYGPFLTRTAPHRTPPRSPRLCLSPPSLFHPHRNLLSEKLSEPILNCGDMCFPAFIYGTHRRGSHTWAGGGGRGSQKLEKKLVPPADQTSLHK